MSAPDPRPHADHDPSLVAAYAAGDATGRGLAEAERLTAACPECAALHRDLRAIAAALPALPAPVRTRDFRITAEQAASLRPSGAAGLLGRLLAPLASARFAFAGPAGAGLAALGIAGILLSGGLGPGATPPGTGAAAPLFNAAPIGSDRASGQVAPAAPTADTGSGQVAYASPALGITTTTAQPPPPAPSAEPSTKRAALATDAAPMPTGNPAALGAGDTPPVTPPSAPSAQSVPTAPIVPSQTGPTPVVVLGFVFVAGGLLLLAARWTARRCA